MTQGRAPTNRVQARGGPRKRPRARAPDRYLTRAEHLAVRTSRRWVAGHPRLVDEWHPTRNIDLWPHEVAAYSKRHVWWKCPRGADHEWSAEVASRTRGNGCPYCAGRRVSITNCLATLAPKAAAEWHPTRNGKHSPLNVRAADTKHFWWKCAKGDDHEWQAAPLNRTPRRRNPAGSPCPFCAGRRLSKTNSLAAVAPNLAAEWHATKNRTLRPTDVRPSDARRVWWKCPKGPDHVFRTRIRERALEHHGCPFCASRRLSVTNSLAALEPELAREWHPTKNGKLTPRDVRASERGLFWWRCEKTPKNYAWQKSLPWRRKNGGVCPYCSSFAGKSPELVKQLHPTKNPSFNPWRVPSSATRKVWWKCPEGAHHVWQTSVRSRAVTGSLCPFCAERAFPSAASLAARFPDIAAQWHPKKNGATTPESVGTGDHRKVWWRCGKPGHEWEGTVAARTRSGVASCPFCDGRRAARSLAVTHPKIAAYWHPTKNGKLTPRDVSARAARRVWWKCPKAPDHVWADTVHQRVEALHPCSFCAQRRRSSTSTLAAMHPETAALWHPTKNGKLTPSHVHAGERRSVWWKCPKGPDHEWKRQIYDLIHLGNGCPFCGGVRASVTNSFAAMFPQLAKLLHPRKNGKIDLLQVRPSSLQKVWWQCARDPTHVWQRTVQDMASRRPGCPECGRGC